MKTPKAVSPREGPGMRGDYTSFLLSPRSATDPTFSSTSADPRVAALRGSDRQRQLRPITSHCSIPS